MKRFFSLLLALCLSVSILSGCGKIAPTGGDTLSIVVTTFPIYDWVREILGDNLSHVELTLLQDNGVDVHSYQPTADDMVKVVACDLMLYMGGTSDAWVEELLEKTEHNHHHSVNLMSCVEDMLLSEETVAGMQEADHDHDHDDDHHDHDDHDDFDDFDEHIWLSLRCAAALCRVIAEELSQLPLPHAEDCATNADAYIASLTELDQSFQQVVDNASCKTVLFGDRFPFRYLTNDYGLTYYAAFSGCSSETEASFQTVTFLAEKMDTLSLPAILVLNGSDQKIATTILQSSQNPNRPILTLDSLQSVVGSDGSYLALMEQNLAVLQQALA